MSQNSRDFEISMLRNEEEVPEVFAFNHRIFSAELGQHASRESGELIDRFHGQNTYFIARKQAQICGMVCATHPAKLSERSVLAKMTHPEKLIPYGHTAVEIRLLAIDPAFRGSRLLVGLIHHVSEFAHRSGYSHALVSAIVPQDRLYEKLGFRAIDVPKMLGNLRFVPMVMDREAFHRMRQRTKTEPWLKAQETPRRSYWLIPCAVAGEADLSAQKSKVASVPPRGDQVKGWIGSSREQLSQLLEAPKSLEPVLLANNGTGVVDAMIQSLRVAGVTQIGVVSNGEFGERLIDQCLRQRLSVRPLRMGHGIFSSHSFHRWLEKENALQAVAMVHLETSLGQLNPLQEVGKAAHRRGLRLLIDATSSCFGDLERLSAIQGISLLGGVSGKCLWGPPGMGFVMADHDFLESNDLGRANAATVESLDLKNHLHFQKWHQEFPHTPPTGLLGAFAESLANWASRDHWLEQNLRQEFFLALREALPEFVSEVPVSHPSVFTRCYSYEKSKEAAFQTWRTQLSKKGIEVYQNERYQKPKGQFQVALLSPLLPRQRDEILAAFQWVSHLDLMG